MFVYNPKNASDIFFVYLKLKFSIRKEGKISIFRVARLEFHNRIMKVARSRGRSLGKRNFFGKLRSLQITTTKQMTETHISRLFVLHFYVI